MQRIDGIAKVTGAVRYAGDLRHVTAIDVAVSITAAPGAMQGAIDDTSRYPSRPTANVIAPLRWRWSRTADSTRSTPV